MSEERSRCPLCREGFTDDGEGNQLRLNKTSKEWAVRCDCGRRGSWRAPTVEQAWEAWEAFVEGWWQGWEKERKRLQELKR